MPKTRKLLREELTYSEAKVREVNLLHQFGYVEKRDQFFAQVYCNRNWIKATIAHHLGLYSPEACHVSNTDKWMNGSFNVCIPVTIEAKSWPAKPQQSQLVMFRIPLPYRLGEAVCPGNSDEKVRCEAGTYALFQQKCSDVPIPRLYGFGMSTGETFTDVGHLPFLTRWLYRLKNMFKTWFGFPVPSRYVRHQPVNQHLTSDFSVPYLLLEYIEDSVGEMLSLSWPKKKHDDKLRTNLFQGLSRLLLSLARLQVPRIGSFIIDNAGYLQLANRPLKFEMVIFENENIPTDIPRDRTYCTVDSYITDTLKMHDNRILHQPNAVNSLNDYSSQTAAITATRAASHLFYDPKLSRGPFVMALDDFNASNMFVDKDWNITCILDLEWVCSQPIEMVQIPQWFVEDKGVDEIASDPEEYGKLRKEFIDILTIEEEKISGSESTQAEESSAPLLSTVMQSGWEKGTFWYTLALHNPTCLFAMFYERIQPLFLAKNKDHDEFQNIMPWYWSLDFVDIALSKVEDKKNYDIQLQKAFED
ncbi:hypothetical protein LOZ61_002951 [Ophidiomyces ophidiicola]|nr:hypothetical protein LOZ61_002951 [Ophidiomyces ophidiicola]KAI1920743.1 hypothetical protein LOZ64_001791 [Ophidiomyces ophidiicola]KAI1928596.1 hypothetical protein LOZ60_002317 [Ophidiomyces ophidiicola]KAI1961215.1 hypothetical protein LOZ59_002464 [Ophidiomyces ophidiicola]KAI2008815.1 hypothetical protein LOZ49_004132 [Ophidiomyces ophidiicola]